MIFYLAAVTFFFSFSPLGKKVVPPHPHFSVPSYATALSVLNCVKVVHLLFWESKYSFRVKVNLKCQLSRGNLKIKKILEVRTLQSSRQQKEGVFKYRVLSINATFS